MKDIPTSPRIIEIRRKRRVRAIRLFILFFILFISLIGALSYFSKDKHVVINKIVITGTHIIDNDNIEKRIRTDLSGKYFYLFSRANSFIYPHKQIYKDLIKDFPRIESLSVSRDGLKTLKIDITERVGYFLYCGTNIPENKEDVGENCYFINNDGLIFDKAPYFSGNIYFKYYMSLEDGSVNPLGQQMTSVDRFHALQRFVDGVSSLGFNPTHMVVTSDGAHSLYLESEKSDNVPKIIFKSENDLVTILDNLSLAMKKPEFASEVNSKYNTLLYIDLRFKNKVLYKFQ